LPLRLHACIKDLREKILAIEKEAKDSIQKILGAKPER